MTIQTNEESHFTSGQLALFSVAILVLLVFVWTYTN